MNWAQGLGAPAPSSVMALMLCAVVWKGRQLLGSGYNQAAVCWCTQAGEERVLDSTWDMSPGERHCQHRGEGGRSCQGGTGWERHHHPL